MRFTDSLQAAQGAEIMARAEQAEQAAQGKQGKQFFGSPGGGLGGGPGWGNNQFGPQQNGLTAFGE